jgi:hypothetical protein
MAKASNWIALFEKFVQDVRINSKEVSDPDGTGTPLVMWESQKRFLHEVGAGLDLGQRIFKNLKGRQQGVTTISLLLVDCFWPAMNPNLKMAHVTDNEANRDANRLIIRNYINSFPEGYFGGQFSILKDNRELMAFSNGSSLHFRVAGTKQKGLSWAEGQGWAAAHLTEVSKYGDAAALKSFTEGFSQSNPNRLYVMESTANGLGNLWNDQWREAKAQPETQRAWFTGWWAADPNRVERKDPRFLRFGLHGPNGEEAEKINLVREMYGWQITQEQLAWIRWRTDQDGDSQMLRQNQPWTEHEAFILSGFSFFPSRLLVKQINHIDETNQTDSREFRFRAYYYVLGDTFFETKLDEITDPETDNREWQLKVWEEPHPNGRYVIGCDTAFGRNDHKDRNAIVVFRCYADRVVQVAEFASSDVEVKHCAWILAHLAGVFKDCIVNIEVNGPGAIIMSEWRTIRGMFASDMYAEQVRSLDWQDALGWARWYLYHRPDSVGAGFAYNTQTNLRVKYDMMHGLKGELATNGAMLRSIPLLKEMSNVVQDGSHIGAPESSSEDCKDDRVFAAALALKAWTDHRKNELIALGLSYDLVTQQENEQIPADPDEAARFRASKAAGAVVARFFKNVAELEKMREEGWTPQNKFLHEHGLE